MWSRHLRIQEFKKRPDALINGINYARVVALYLYDQSYAAIIKKLVFSFAYRPRLDVSGIWRPMLIFYSVRNKRRPDYDFIIEEIRAVSGNNAQFCDLTEQFSPIQWIRTLRYFPATYKAAKSMEPGVIRRVALAALIAKFRSFESTAERLIGSRTRVVTFCDAHPHDNLVTQLANNGGAFTITAQHGQYRILDSTNVSSDAEAYANFVSDRLLAWGEATVAEFTRYDIPRERMAVTGWIREIPKVSPKRRREVFGVVLNGGNGADSNIALINAANMVAEALNMQYVVRAHPTYGAPGYHSFVSSRCLHIGAMSPNDYIIAVDFSLSHASSATIELLLADSPVYVLDDGGIASIFRVEGLSFDDMKTLIAVIESDLRNPEQAVERVLRLKNWFNDEADSNKTRAAIFE